ncbi:transcription modulator YdgT, partial [Salmonella enterica]|nr:transcription modulator YdgT [Salmonella enterica]EBC6549087.1 transcription modulator YdgT [Salmonella enterica]
MRFCLFFISDYSVGIIFNMDQLYMTVQDYLLKFRKISSLE